MKKIITLTTILFAGFTAANAQAVATSSQTASTSVQSTSADAQTVAVDAQATSSASQNVSLTLQNAINISITSATGTNFTFDDVTKYQSGLTNTSASAFLVKSNRPWAVTVKAAAATFSGPAAPATQMPSSVLGVRLNGGSAFGSLSTTAAALTSGTRGSSTFSIDYNANPGYSYDAGTYNLSVVYTATQQ